MQDITALRIITDLIRKQSRPQLKFVNNFSLKINKKICEILCMYVYITTGIIKRYKVSSVALLIGEDRQVWVRTSCKLKKRETVERRNRINKP